MESELQSSHVTIQREGQGASVELDPRFTEEIAALVGGLDLAHCFQCGVCSGSCPTMARMTYGPRKIMHMIHLGLADRVLRSQDIWYCVSCFSCAARCPQGIEIADVMSALRNMAVAKGLARDKEATFSQIFIKVLQEHGRMYEPEVLLRYYASVRDLGAMVKIAPLGLRMFLKSKIGLVPQRIENATELADIAARINGRGGE